MLHGAARAFAGLLVSVSPSLAVSQSPPPIAEQIAAAVQALPKEMRDGAGVMGYKTAGKLELLRPVRNGMLCLADDPAEEQFHVSCYADSMEPFMARGRALRAQGVKGAQVDTARFAEVKAGKLTMPTKPAALYQIFGPKDAYDAATNSVKGGRALFVVYIPFATAESTGLSTVPSDSKPWLMLPGTPKAHIMFSATM
ncbi:MAG: hypothetical protein ACK6DP_05755 [Gemmatimonas sp.]|jgi:hypothetical protein|uniref:hypothetical protein n=1 Tax=Gemmatimonas sp. TaxID=1962908 RepID=UPI00391F9B17|nr:hypothetical protein [Gemmatimonadota bacterium]